MNRMCSRIPVRGVLALAASLFLGSCGGGTIVAGGGTGGTGISTGVITGFGSIIVNMIEFGVDNAVITLNESPASESELRVGMVAKIRGTFNDDGLTGAAEKIDVEHEVQGAVSGSPGGDSFTVLGQTVLVNGQTGFENVAGVTDLAPGDVVEVFGFRDGLGNLRATFVRPLPGPADNVLRGIVANHDGDPKTFTIGGQLVDYRSASITPEGETIVEGAPVDVRGTLIGTTLFADRVIREDLEDGAFVPKPGEKVDVEGFVSSFDVLLGTFKVGGQRVRVTAGTRFEGGTFADLQDNVFVEAEGRLDAGGALVADKMEIE